MFIVCVCTFYCVNVNVMCILWFKFITVCVFLGEKPRFLKGILGDVNDVCMEYFIIANYEGDMKSLKNGRFTEF